MGEEFKMKEVWEWEIRECEVMLVNMYDVYVEICKRKNLWKIFKNKIK